MAEVKTNRNTRTKNSMYNLIFGIGAEVIAVIMNFIVRTVFINTLGSEYLGISSLFSNILSLLSISELGVGTAILYKLYQPLAEQDTHRIQVLMKFYRRAYRVIAIIIVVIGLCLIPLLPYLISDYDSLAGMGLNAVVIYLLYLMQTASTYLFMGYRAGLMKADQREYILSIVKFVFTIVKNVLEIVALIYFKNFYIYVGILVVSVVLENIVNGIIVKKSYPYITDKINDKMSHEEFKSTLKDCGALALYRISGTVVRSTDNIVISAFLGLTAVAMYSNYYIFYTTIATIFVQVANAFSHSVGNLHTTKNTDHEYLIFKALLLILLVMGGTATIGIFCVADEFIAVWVGEEWALDEPFAMLMGFLLFSEAIRALIARYREVYALFNYNRIRPVISIVVNIVVSILLVNVWGICGVLVGTIVTDWFTIMVTDPFTIYKHAFNGKFKTRHFYFRVFSNMAVMIVMAVLLKLFCTYCLTGMGWITVILHILICAVAYPLVFLLINCRTEECRYLFKVAKDRIQRRKNKGQNAASSDGE